jgi:membrane-bound lytic murein transglycosylase MltF
MQPPPPIDIADMEVAENNIHAGAKILRNIVDTYLNDDMLDPANKMFMALASYNAGPNRIAEARRKALDQGFDPNQWFGNVELVVAKEIGQETVQYVNNIYKYYVAYKLVLQQSSVR